MQEVALDNCDTYFMRALSGWRLPCRFGWVGLTTNHSNLLQQIRLVPLFHQPLFAIAGAAFGEEHVDH